MLQYLCGFTISVVASALLTWRVRNLANRFGLAMAPPSARHIHRTPTPRLGGVAVFLTFMAVFGAYLLAGHYGLVTAPSNPDVLKIVLLSVAFFALGLMDDLKPLGAWTKLTLQVAGGLALYASGIHFGFCSSLGHTPWISQAVCLSLTVFWVVLVCNAINLIDGLDGLAAGAALFSMVTIFTLAAGGRPGVATATAILGGSVFGFLIFNFNPASIFLGDSGSLFVGFMLSGFVLAESQKQSSTLDAIFVPVLSFALPLTDVAVSIVRRFLSGHSVFGADREHIHHKLLEMGLTQRQVVWILYGFAAFCTILSFFLLDLSDVVVVPVAAIVLLVVFFGLRKLEYQEFMEFRQLWRRAARQKRTMARNIQVRKSAARLESTSDPRTLVELLEECLTGDFDGFTIVLSDEFAAAAQFPSPWKNGVVRQQWNSSVDELVISLELTGRNGLPVGKLFLYQNIGSAFVLDPNLLKGHLRDAVAVALQNAVMRPRLTQFLLPELPVPPSATVTPVYADSEAQA